MPLSGPGTFASFFGSAADGDAAFTSPSAATLTKYSVFGRVTVSGPGGLDVAGNPLFCRQLIIDSTSPGLFAGAIRCNGQPAGALNATANGRGALGGFFGPGGDGGLGGRISGNPSVPGLDATNGLAPPGLSIGGAGGTGGSGLSGARGVGGVPSPLPAQYARVVNFLTALTGMFIMPGGLIVPSGGGGGGGGGRVDGNGAAPGGAGGGSGGVLFVCAEEIIVTGNNPHFGARGGNGGDANNAAGAGGGGGGGGGGIILVFAKLTGNLVTSVDGGRGGSGSVPGNPGANGNLFTFQV